VIAGAFSQKKFVVEFSAFNKTGKTSTRSGYSSRSKKQRADLAKNKA